jgi:hypothetical protein
VAGIIGAGNVQVHGMGDIETALWLNVGRDTVVLSPHFAGAQFDVIRGIVGSLLTEIGAPGAECVTNDDLASSVEDPSFPDVGEAFWYLARRVDASGAGSYNTDGPGQAAERDEELDQLLESCP